MRITLLSLLILLGLTQQCVGQQDSIAPKGSNRPDSTEIRSLPTRNIQSAGAIAAPEAIAFLDSLYSSVPMYFQDGDQYYFYVVNGNWVPYDKAAAAPKYLMGIVNENNDTILPPNYHKIYTPNATAKGYIEIEKDGKRGLINYRTRQLIPATFDVIFPSQTDGVLAIGKRNNQYYTLLANGSEQLITDKAMFPSYLSLLTNIVFDIKDYYPLREVYAFGKTPSNQVAYFYRTGIIAPPSYLIETGLVDEWISNVAIEGGSSLEKLLENRISIEQTKTTPWGFSWLISSFYEEGVNGRSNFATTTKSITAIDTNNNVIDKAVLYEAMNEARKVSLFQATYRYNFVSDSLIEVAYFSFFDDDSEVKQPYHLMTLYKYFAITPTGAINGLSCNRIYPFTKYVYLTETYFKGRYVKLRLANENTVNWPEDKDMQLYISDYLSVDDLDLMYNEILAEYGYKFADEKWAKYFESKKWYNPRFDYVDDKLNPYERANLKLIKSTRDKVAKNPKKYINGRFESND